MRVVLRRRYWAGIDFGLRQRLDGERDRERRALVVARARRENLPAVHLDELLHDGQAETEPAVLSSGGAIALSEAIEYEGQQLVLDPLACVCDDNFRVCTGMVEQDLYAPARGRELNRVGEQVPDDLIQADGIAVHGGSRTIEDGFELDALGFGGGPN